MFTDQECAALRNGCRTFKGLTLISDAVAAVQPPLKSNGFPLSFAIISGFNFCSLSDAIEGNGATDRSA